MHLIQYLVTMTLVSAVQPGARLHFATSHIQAMMIFGPSYKPPGTYCPKMPLILLLRRAKSIPLKSRQ